jgi:hypothetical protein
MVAAGCHVRLWDTSGHEVDLMCTAGSSHVSLLRHVVPAHQILDGSVLGSAYVVRAMVQRR